MEVATGVLNHVILAKFKDELSPEKADELIKEWANLINIIEPMKGFHWGTDVSIGNRHDGFTHIFVCIFESIEGITEYFYHPSHVEFGKKVMPHVEKLIVVDYKPIIVKQ